MVPNSPCLQLHRTSVSRSHHVHQQRKIHSFKSFWNSFFLFFLLHKITKELQKAPLNRPVVTGAAGGFNTPLAGRLHKTVISYSLSNVMVRQSIHSSTHDAGPNNTWVVFIRAQRSITTSSGDSVLFLPFGA